MPQWLFKANPIAIDTETFDPRLSRDEGPGYCHREGFVCGISMAADNGRGKIESVYLPIKHDGDNLDQRMVVQFMKDLIASEAKTFIFANATYDLGWLKTLGITGFDRHTVRDVQVAEPLLNEEKQDGYSLEALSQGYLGRGKGEGDMDNQAGADWKSRMHLIPARFVGPYAEMDARNTYEIYFKQIPRLKKEQLWNVFELESKVTLVCHALTTNGVRVSTQKAEEAIATIDPLIKFLARPLKGININSPDEIGPYLVRNGFKETKTKSGRICTRKKLLEAAAAAGNKEARRIVTLRNMTKLKNDFLIGGLLKNQINGRVHSQFNQLKGDTKGTMTGRFSSSNPNLQQIPKRSRLSKIIRACYLPEEGDTWMQADYSSQEPRLQVHYGLLWGLDGAEVARDFFINETPKGRKLYHLFMELIPGLSYDDAKSILLGRSYNMGIKSLAEKLGISFDEAKDLLYTFDARVPYIKKGSDRAEADARTHGFIRTLLGRKRRFDWYVPDHPDFRGKNEDDEDEFKPAYGYQAAERKFHRYTDQGYRLVRAFTSKAYNALIQGGSADQTKVAAVKCYEAGFGSSMRLQVHDELDFSLSNPKDSEKIKNIMETSMTLLLPTMADCSLKKHW